MQDLLSYARILPAVHQIEVHPFFRNQYNVDFCHSKVCLLSQSMLHLSIYCHICFNTAARYAELQEMQQQNFEMSTLAMRSQGSRRLK